MLHSVSKKIVAKSICNGYIDKSQTEEYIYGLDLVGNIIITDLSTLIIGLCFGMIWESIMFWLFYKLLRKYCGGYHFNTSLKCYISSIVLCIIVLSIIKCVSYPIYFKDVLMLISSMILLICVPVAAVNKPLNEKEVAIYRKIAITLVLVLVAMYLTARFCEWQTISEIAPLSVVSVTIFVIVGKINVIYRQRLALNEEN